jgi:hypothetical protein
MTFRRTPKIVRQCCQNQLVQNWTRKLPLLQKKSPAETASRYLETIINEVEAKDRTPLNVIDFCAGGGGPTPIFERLINARRTQNGGKPPLQFLLTDLYPNIPAWEAHAKKSDNLTYIEESVDATQPPPSALSITAPSRTSSTYPQTRIFRLFNLSFHHFPTPLAKDVLLSTLQNSDGFAIIELQDRRFGCLLTMLMNVFLVLAVTPLWFPPWRNKIHNLLTYTGILPFVLCWDGVASCIRTREFEEVIAIIGQIEGVEPSIRHGKEVGERQCEIKDWMFTARRELHTWPFGYVNFTTGVKKSKEHRLVE